MKRWFIINIMLVWSRPIVCRNNSNDITNLNICMHYEFFPNTSSEVCIICEQKLALFWSWQTLSFYFFIFGVLRPKKPQRISYTPTVTIVLPSDKEEYLFHNEWWRALKAVSGRGVWCHRWHTGCGKQSHSHSRFSFGSYRCECVTT